MSLIGCYDRLRKGKKLSHKMRCFDPSIPISSTLLENQKQWTLNKPRSNHSRINILVTCSAFHHETTMKCLSLKQPYAHLLEVVKKFSGHLLIHTLNTDNAACKRLNINQEPLRKGGILGKAYLSDVQYYGTKREFQSDKITHFAPTGFHEKGLRYGFLIRNAKQFTNPIPIVITIRNFLLKNDRLVDRGAFY